MTGPDPNPENARKWLAVALPMCGVCMVEMECESLGEGDAPEGEGGDGE